jgi:hypothetical protein
VRPSGTIFCLGSGAAFGAMAIFGKLAYGEGASVGTLLAVRFALAAALFWGVVLVAGAGGGLRGLRRRDLGAVTRSRPGATSRPCSGSMPRCCRSCCTPSRRSWPARPSRWAGSESTAGA